MTDSELRTIIGRATDPQKLQRFCGSMARARSSAAEGERTAMFSLIRGSQEIRKKLNRSKKLRTAWAAYSARSCIYGYYLTGGLLSSGDLASGLKQNLKTCTGADYDRTAELERREWVVPLSGSLDADLAVNFTVRTLSAVNDLDEWLECMEKLYAFSEFVVCEGMRQGGFAVAPAPRYETTAEGMEKFFKELTASPRQEPVWTPERKAALAVLTDPDSGFSQACVSPVTRPAGEGKKGSLSVPNVGTFNNKAILTPQDADAMPVAALAGGGNKDALIAMRNLDGKKAAAMTECIQNSALIYSERAQMNRELDALGTTSEQEERIQQLEKENRELQNQKDAAETRERAGAQALENARQRADRAEKTAARVENAEAALKQAQDQLAALQAELDAMRKRSAAMEEETDALEEALFEATNPENEEADESELASLDVSCFEGLNVLVIGGHPTFLAGMQQLNANVRYVGVTKPSDSAIINSDVVWWQTNYLSHKFYRPIMAVIRTYGIPVRYFTSAGHVGGRIQLVRETEKMIAQGILHPRKDRTEDAERT